MNPRSTDLAQPAPAAGTWVTRGVLQLILTQVVFGLSWSLYLLLPKFLTTALHAGPEAIGLMSTAGGVAGVLIMPFAGFGLDRLGRTLFFRLGAALVVLTSIAFLQVTEIGPLVYVLQGCVAVSWVLAFNALAARMADVAPPEKLGQAIGWLGSANVATNAISTAIAEPLAASYGWDAVFELGIALGAVAFALSFALGEEPRRGSATSSAPPSVPAAGDRGSLWSILVAATFAGSAFAAIYHFIQPYALGAGAVEVRAFFIGFTLAAVMTRLSLGSLGDRRGRRVVSAWMLVGYALCGLLTARLDPDRLLLYGLAFGAAHGVAYPTMSALVLEVISPSRRGLGLVLFNGAFQAGTAVSGLGWGLLAKHQGYPAVYATSAVCSLLAACVLWSGRQRAPRSADAT
jgi:predicted MFS family arabinose efflux permease